MKVQQNLKEDYLFSYETYPKTSKINHIKVYNLWKVVIRRGYLKTFFLIMEKHQN